MRELNKPSAPVKGHLEITPRRLALVRKLPLDERLKAAATVVAEGQPIKPSKHMVAGLYAVSIAGIDKTLNGSRRRWPRIAPETLAALDGLWREVLFLAGLKYQGPDYQRERLVAFERFLAKWLIDHPEIQHLDAIGPGPALHATAVNALWALVEAIVAGLEGV